MAGQGQKRKMPPELQKLMAMVAATILFFLGLSQVGNPEVTADVIVLTAAPAQLAFWVLYTFRSPFWIKPLGRALWVKSTALMLVLCFPALAYIMIYFFGREFVVPEEIKVVVYGLAWTGIYGQTWQLIRLQRKEHELIAQQELAKEGGTE